MISNPIIAPRAGDPMRASWGAAVAERANECAAAIDALRGPGGLTSLREPVAALLAPFACRYHEVEDGGAQWEIYIPDGCCNYGGSCAPVNPAASESGGGHEDDAAGWRVLYLDEDAGATGTDNDGNSYREWRVEIHVKPSAKMWQVDDLNKPARRLVWACVVDILKDPATVTEEERYANTPGDSWSCIVARVRVTDVEEDGETHKLRTVTHLRRTPVDVADYGETLAGFGLVWYLSVENDALQVNRVYCVRQQLALAGIAVTGDTMTDVTDAEQVFAKIDTSEGVVSGIGLVSVVADPDSGDTSTSGDFVTWLLLYVLVRNTVTGDYRENSTRNVQIYRA